MDNKTWTLKLYLSAFLGYLDNRTYFLFPVNYCNIPPNCSQIGETVFWFY